jgi:thiosulfate/3-mercaptopyruvate sulfurtransferase
MKRRLLLTASLTLLTGGLSAHAQAPYPRPELLVETSWLASHLSEPGMRLVDMRSGPAYAEAHLPGAVRLEEGPLRNATDKLSYLPRPEVLASMLGQAGITNTTRVVIYDDQGGRAASRLWYVLNAYGHEKVSLVNGGWTKWIAEKRPTTVDVPAIEAATFTPKVTPTLGCTAPELLARKPGVIALDARSPTEHRTGRVPGAVNVEWKENLLSPSMTFKPAGELKRLYESKGITPDREVVTYCASGGRASLSLFALKLLGYPKVKVYYGSWSDYTTRPNAPVEK